MRRDFRVIDSDGHTFEPPDLYDKYMDPEFRSRVTLDGLNTLRMSMRSVDGKSIRSTSPSATSRNFVKLSWPSPRIRNAETIASRR